MRHAEKAGARLHEETTVTEAVTDERTGRVVGVTGHVGRGKDKRPGHLPRPAHPGLRRRLRPARAEPRHGQARRPPDGRRRAPLLHAARAPTTTTSRATSSCGTAPTRRTPSCCPATAGSSAWATARRNVGLGILSTSRAYGSTDYRALLRSWLDGTPAGVGLPRGERRGPGRRRGAADGLQPHAALPARACCWSATRAAWSTRSTARASPTPWSRRRSRRGAPSSRSPAAGAAAEAALESYPTQMRAGARRLLPHRQRVLPADRQPDGHGAGHPSRPAPPAR